MSTFSSYLQGPFSLTVRSHRTNEHGQALPDRFFICNADDVMAVAEYETLHDALSAKSLLNKVWFAAQEVK